MASCHDLPPWHRDVASSETFQHDRSSLSALQERLVQSCTASALRCFCLALLEPLALVPNLRGKTWSWSGAGPCGSLWMFRFVSVCCPPVISSDWMSQCCGPGRSRPFRQRSSGCRTYWLRRFSCPETCKKSDEVRHHILSPN